MIKDIAFFAYAVTDIKKARAFYEGVLGLRPNGQYDKNPESQWIEYDIGQTTLGIGCAPGMWEPSAKGASAALEVDDFDKTLAHIKAEGVTILMGPHDFSPCRMVVISDPDGNRITLHKRKQG